MTFIDSNTIESVGVEHAGHLTTSSSPRGGSSNDPQQEQNTSECG